ncbi:MAG: HAMP domain-containing histidine kinase [Cyclobacteriaceae bacterium]
MKNTPIRFLVVLGTLSMVAILVVQVYWVTQAIDREEEQFNHSVQMAMRNVVESLCQINGNDIPSNDPIDQLSRNYFIARTNYKIDLKSLDYLLRAELQKRNIDEDYEYGVYDCQTDRMVYGDFVSLRDLESEIVPTGQLPKLVNDEYYFGIYFPGKTAGLVSNLALWQLTSGLTLLILIFFSYALFIILRQKRLSEIQRDFINNMTHEFKTPLATLQVSADVLSQEAQSDRQRRYTDIVKQELSRMELHVHQLLETSVLDRQQDKKEKIVLLKALIDQTDHFQSLANKGFEASLEGLSASSQVLGEPRILETLFFNLLDNAFKYSENQVSLKAWEDKKYCYVEIKNDGRTISKRDQKKIFNKFYRVTDGDLHDVKGFGLGLYFVKQAVRKMNGKVTVDSQNDETSFLITIPKTNG